jgi:hypothetical protein
MLGNLFGGCRPGDDTCSFNAISSIFDIPVIAGAGSVRGELFIKGPSGLGLRGDARDFDPAPNPGKSRAFFDLDFERGIGVFQVNPTCTAAAETVCTSALPFGAGNSLTVAVEKNTVKISASLRNSVGGNRGLNPAVDIEVSVTGNTKDLIAHGVRDPFPSLEITRTVNGVISRHYQFPESRVGPLCLTGICGSHSFAVP